MSIYESRPTLIDSDTEISATVEQTELDGVCVFLRLRDGLNDVHTVTLQAGDWTMFSQAVGDMIDRRIKQGAAERSEPKNGKVTTFTPSRCRPATGPCSRKPSAI